MNNHLHVYTADCDGDGDVVAEVENPAVSCEILEDVLQWREEDCCEADIITRLRSRTVPEGYTYSSWVPGMMI